MKQKTKKLTEERRDNMNNKKSTWKRMMALMFAMVLMVGTVMPVYAKTPILEVVEAPIPEGKAGQKLKVDFTLRNTSNYIAKNVNIKPIVNSESPFIINELNTKKRVDYITPRKENTFTYTLEVKKEAQEGIYPLTFDVNFINTDGIPSTKQETVYVKITTSHIPTELVIDQVNYDESKAIAGEEFEVGVVIQNRGTLYAKNIYIDFGVDDKFAIKDNQASFFEVDMGAFVKKEYKTVLIPRKDLKEGNYPIAITIKYTDGFGKQQTKVGNINVSIKGSGDQGDASLKIENLKGPKAVAAGKNFDISFILKNTGSSKAEKINVSVGADSTKIVPITLNKDIINSLEAGEEKQMTFTFKGLEDIEGKNYPIRIGIDYGKDTKVNLEQYVGVLINNEKTKNSATVPIMIIDAYESQPQIVKAGENFTLKMKLWNTNSEKAVKNMKVTLTVNGTSEKTNDDVFTPVKGSNTFYIPFLAPNGKWDQEISFFTVPDAKAKTYKVQASFDYEYDQDGNVTKGSGQDIIGIPVVQPTKLDVADIPEIFGASVNKDANLEVSFYNTGKVAISNLLVKVEGNFDIRDGQKYVGRLEVGSQDWFNGVIIPREEGQQSGKVVFTYEDTSGKMQQLEREFSMMVGPEEVKNTNFLQPTQPEDQGNKSKMPIFLIGGGVLVAIIIVVLLIKKKKGKGMKVDETL